MAKKDDAGSRPAAEPVPAASRPGISSTASRSPESDVRSGGGKEGPPSSLKTKQGSPTGATAGGSVESGRDFGNAKAQDYDVQCHTDEKGLEVVRVSAESGDEAANKALAQKGYKGVSIRGVTPATDPDPNSLGGEREASIMIHNADNLGDAGANRFGTDANREASEKLGRADIKELGE